MNLLTTVNRSRFSLLPEKELFATFLLNNSHSEGDCVNKLYSFSLPRTNIATVST